MDKTNPELEEIVEEIKDYVNVSADLFKMKASEKGAVIASNAIINIILAAVAALALQFISIAAAFGLAEVTGKNYLGFLIVAGFYAFVGLIILMTKDKWLKHSLVNSIIKQIYSHDR